MVLKNLKMQKQWSVMSVISVTPQWFQQKMEHHVISWVSTAGAFILRLFQSHKIRQVPLFDSYFGVLIFLADGVLSVLFYPPDLPDVYIHKNVQDNKQNFWVQAWIHGSCTLNLPPSCLDIGAEVRTLPNMRDPCDTLWFHQTRQLHVVLRSVRCKFRQMTHVPGAVVSLAWGCVNNELCGVRAPPLLLSVARLFLCLLTSAATGFLLTTTMLWCPHSWLALLAILVQALPPPSPCSLMTLLR